jgi:hypothetical protein
MPLLESKARVAARARRAVSVEPWELAGVAARDLSARDMSARDMSARDMSARDMSARDARLLSSGRERLECERHEFGGVAATRDKSLLPSLSGILAYSRLSQVS